MNKTFQKYFGNAGLIFPIELGDRHNTYTIISEDSFTLKATMPNHFYIYPFRKATNYKIINETRFPMKEWSADEIEAKGFDQPPVDVFMTPEELSCFRHKIICVAAGILCFISWVFMLVVYLLRG